MSHAIVRKKIDAGKIFNCKKFEPFINSIVEVLSFRGISMSHFYICEIEGVRFLTKLSFYRKTAPELYKGTSKNTIPQIEAEIRILQLLRDNIINKGISPCILELVYEKRCSGVSSAVNRKKCKDISFGGENSVHDSVEQIICLYGDMVQRGLAHDKCAFVVLERCDITLDEYLRKMYNTPTNVAVFKSILFQIIYTLYAITAVYPKFRHQDLHTENVMLKIDYKYKFDPARPKYMKFIVHSRKDRASTKSTDRTSKHGGKKDSSTNSTDSTDSTDRVFYVPYFGIIAKIIDFGFSQIPEEGVISNVTDDLVSMFYRSKNDLLLLFYWINNVLQHSPSQGSIDILNMLEKLEPARSYVAYQTERIRHIESQIPTYNDMISNGVFAEYRKVAAGDIFGTYEV